MLPGKNRHGRDTNERFQALLPRILLKLCSDTAARTHPVSCRSRGGQALLQPRDQSRERGELHVRSVVGRRERAGQPSRRRQARAHQVGVAGAQALGQRLEELSPRVTAEESYRHLSQPGLVFCRFIVLLVAAQK
jgi:hypothetical protein